MGSPECSVCEKGKECVKGMEGKGVSVTTQAGEDVARESIEGEGRSTFNSKLNKGCGINNNVSDDDKGQTTTKLMLNKIRKIMKDKTRRAL